MSEVSEAKVEDVMEHGVLTCQADTPVRAVARIMADRRVHSVVVTDLDEGGPRAWGIVTDVDMLRAARDDADEQSAGKVAGTELLTVAPTDPLEAAVTLMVEHEVTHVLVESEGRPVGVVSTLDVAELLAS